MFYEILLFILIVISTSYYNVIHSFKKISILSVRQLRLDAEEGVHRLTAENCQKQLGPAMEPGKLSSKTMGSITFQTLANR